MQCLSERHFSSRLPRDQHTPNHPPPPANQNTATILACGRLLRVLVGTSGARGRFNTRRRWRLCFTLSIGVLLIRAPLFTRVCISKLSNAYLPVQKCSSSRKRSPSQPRRFGQRRRRLGCRRRFWWRLDVGFRADRSEGWRLTCDFYFGSLVTSEAFPERRLTCDF